MSQAVTANRLGDGRVVFLTASGEWTTRFAEAAFAPSEADAAPALEIANRDVGRQLIVDPYLVDVDQSGATPRPSKLREAIRAFGPTIAYAPDALLEAAE